MRFFVEFSLLHTQFCRVVERWIKAGLLLAFRTLFIFFRDIALAWTLITLASSQPVQRLRLRSNVSVKLPAGRAYTKTPSASISRKYGALHVLSKLTLVNRNFPSGKSTNSRIIFYLLQCGFYRCPAGIWVVFRHDDSNLIANVNTEVGDARK